MDIGNQKNNYTYYEGYEGEAKIILCLENIQTIHIWEGYFDDIYDTPPLNGKGWKGFTRDYHQFEGIFSDKEISSEINPKEYLDDLLQYKEKAFDFDETTDVFNLIVSLFEKAIEMKTTIKAEKI